MASRARWHNVSIRQLLLLTTLIAVGVFLVERNTRPRRAAETLESMGAQITYLGGRSAWLESALGRAGAQRVTAIRCEGEQFGDEHLHYLLQFPGLVQLSLANSRITDEGLTQISQLPELARLNLAGTRVTNRGVEHLQALPRLKDLNVNGSDVGGGAYAPRSPYDSLLTLSLSDTKTGDADLASLPKLLPKLRRLSLRNTPVTDAGVGRLTAMKSLVQVDLRGTRVTRRGRHELMQHSQVRGEFDWDPRSYIATDVRPSTLEELRWMSDLDELTLHSRDITDSHLKLLRFVPSLATLKIDECSIHSLQSLRHVPQLSTLSIEDCPIDEAGFADVGACRRLSTLELRRVALTDDALRHFAPLDDLASLSLTKVQVSGAGIVHLDPTAKAKLIQLSLRECPVTAAGLKEVAELPALMFLNLAGSPVDDECVVALAGLRGLRAIDLAETEITDAAASALRKLPNLSSIDLSHTKVTDAGVTQLSFPATGGFLEITGTQITDAAVRETQRKYPKCEVKR